MSSSPVGCRPDLAVDRDGLSGAAAEARRVAEGGLAGLRLAFWAIARAVCPRRRGRVAVGGDGGAARHLLLDDIVVTDGDGTVGRVDRERLRVVDDLLLEGEVARPRGALAERGGKGKRVG